MKYSKSFKVVLLGILAYLLLFYSLQYINPPLSWYQQSAIVAIVIFSVIVFALPGKTSKKMTFGICTVIFAFLLSFIYSNVAAWKAEDLCTPAITAKMQREHIQDGVDTNGLPKRVNLTDECAGKYLPFPWFKTAEQPPQDIQQKHSGKVVNLTGLDFFRAQIVAPNDYFVFTDSMLVSPTSQGGMAPPQALLVKDNQVLDYKNYFDFITKNGQHECIAVWTTKGFSTITDWNGSITNFKGDLTDKQTISVGKRNAEFYTMHLQDRNVYVGFLKIGDKDDTTYYFNTCNDKNKDDFEKVITSLKLQSDNNSQ